MSTAQREDDVEWELINDDGFVYKRKKRPRLNSTSSTAPPHPPDPAVEEKHRRRRKKRALLKLKDKYLKEFRQWELLSNTLKEMQETANIQTQKRRELNSTSCFDEANSSNQPSAQSTSDSTHRQLIDELFSQAGAQEAIIRDVSFLCDLAEVLCSAQEERLKQQFTDLPIWESSAHELMEALTEQ
ncbi:uncharacterized protein LOC111409302 [Olea europaea var. sylvestris]|uniref:Uncharacterized protein n=1 Tax=Olea europaea subsp. europaea TaxID=158383 RepID=A0A8S0V9E2_OLEEU|nr:uncharacterized protein LOC111409302 [Olea europaea var. sylvestris]CAA3027540.1 Hypothetical predicted protein [Olea europaea subsp. europaea]